MACELPLFMAIQEPMSTWDKSNNKWKLSFVALNV
jgi:hypothetical protein